MKHQIGNYYKLLGHIIRFEELLPGRRCKLSCDSSCCTGSSGLQVECPITDLDEMEFFKEAIKESKWDWQRGDTAEIREKWERAGEVFRVLGPAVQVLAQWWVPVDDPEDDEKGPTFHKEVGLQKIIVTID